MFKKVNWFIDSPLVKRMNADTLDGRKLRSSPGLWGIMQLVPDLIRVGYTGIPYVTQGTSKERHVLGFFANDSSPDFEKFCIRIPRIRRVEVAISLIQDGGTFMIKVTMYGPKDPNTDGSLVHLLLSTDPATSQTTLIKPVFF